MDIKAYINSGILELYVLDALEPALAQEVEDMVARHPEVREELAKIELSLEGLAHTLAPEVNPEVLDRAMQSIRMQPGESIQGASSNNVPKTPAQKIARGSLSSWLPWGLFVASLLALGWLYQQVSEQQAAIEDLNRRYTTLQRDCSGTEDALRNTQQRIQYISNPATNSILLAGTPNAPEKSALIFNNEENGKTYLRATNLPVPPAGKQYQLWAIDAEGPKSIAVLDTDISSDSLLEVDFVANTATFAITLEDEGGKDSPDLTQLQVAGNVSS